MTDSGCAVKSVYQVGQAGHGGYTLNPPCGLGSGEIRLLLDLCNKALQAAKKAIGRRVIPPITFSAHALLHLHDRQMLTIFSARILAAPVGMMQ